MGATPCQDLGRGTPPQSRPGKGVPDPDMGMSSPCPGEVPGWGVTPNWYSIACTCYAAGGMPLAFTQDFLVLSSVHYFVVVTNIDTIHSQISHLTALHNGSVVVCDRDDKQVKLFRHNLRAKEYPEWAAIEQQPTGMTEVKLKGKYCLAVAIS